MSGSALMAAVARRSMAFAQTMARPFAEGSMNSLVIITRPGEGGFNEQTREYTKATTTLVYDDPDYPGLGAKAGITLAEGPTAMNIGDETQYYSSATVFIPASVPINPRVDDIVLVMANPDSDMVGRYFRVMGVPVGGRVNASSALSVVGIAPSRQWSTT